MKQEIKTKKVLGKGLSSLLATASSYEKKGPSPEGKVMELEIDQISLNKKQPRKHFAQEELKELALSIKEHGVLQPLIVNKDSEGNYLLIAGERRLRASQIAGQKKVPVVLKRLTQEEGSLVALIENIQREQLSCIEEAHAYLGLMEEHGLTQDEIATKVGKKRSSIANFLRILKLAPEVQEWLKEGKLSFGHGKILGSIEPEEKQVQKAKKTIEKGWSVHQLAQEVKGSSSRPTPATNKKEKNSAILNEMARYLEEKTGFHIKISAKNVKEDLQGELKVCFYGREELNRICERMVSS